MILVTNNNNEIAVNQTSNPIKINVPSSGDVSSIALAAAAQASASAAQAALYEGYWLNNASAVISDTSVTYAGGATAGQFIQTRSEGFSYEIAASGATDHHVTTSGGLKLYLRGIVLTQSMAPSADIASIAYTRGVILWVKRTETVKLVYNSALSHDLRLMSEWASLPHFVEQGGTFFLEIADGLHNVNTYIDITNQGKLDIRGTLTPTLLDIASATFSGTTGLVTATINVTTALPARVVPGFAVGGLNIEGDGGAEILNTGMIVVAVNTTTQFTALVRQQGGVNLGAFTTPDTTDPSRLGLPLNKIVVPFCTIRAAETGWDGAAREGFINVLNGSSLYMRHVGIAYNGTTGDNDLISANEPGSLVNIEDYTVLAGSGEMSLRSSYGASITTNRTIIGGAGTGKNAWQGSFGGTFTAIRTMMGSFINESISCSAQAYAALNGCKISGSSLGVRTTYSKSSVVMTNCDVSFCLQGLRPETGFIEVDTNTSVKYCTNPISLTTVGGGKVIGNPAFVGNVNSPPTANLVNTVSGGVWIPSPAPIFHPLLQPVGRFTASLDFGSIAAGATLDLTITATNAALQDFVLVTRTTTWPASLGYEAFVSSANTVTIRCTNNSAAPIDPGTANFIVLVIRATP